MTSLVVEGSGDEEMSFALEIVIGIANLLQARLVSTVRPVLATIRFVFVFNAITKWILCARELPGKDAGEIIRFCQGGGIRLIGVRAARRPVITH